MTPSKSRTRMRARICPIPACGIVHSMPDLYDNYETVTARVRSARIMEGQLVGRSCKLFRTMSATSATG